MTLLYRTKDSRRLVEVESVVGNPLVDWKVMSLGGANPPLFYSDAALHAFYEPASTFDELVALRVQLDAVYRERNLLVRHLATVYPAHLTEHPASDVAWDPVWRAIVCVHGPHGQMTWHLHALEVPFFDFLHRMPNPFLTCVWDGHSTEEKYRRLHASVVDRTTPFGE